MKPKIQKLPKVAHGKVETYMVSAENAAKRAGDLIAQAHGVDCVSIPSLSEVVFHAVCVHTHTHILKDRWNRPEGDMTVTHIDVLFNPRKLPCAVSADLAYALVQARVDELKAKFGVTKHVQGLHELAELKALSQDCHAISVLFRASVVEVAGKVLETGLSMSAHSRRDKIGNLNAVEYGYTATAPANLLTIPLGIYPIGKNDWKFNQESWAGFQDKAWSEVKDLNAQRVVEASVVCSKAGYGNLNQEDVISYTGHSSVEAITRAIQETLNRDAQLEEMKKLQAEILDAGWIIRSGNCGCVEVIPVSVDEGGKTRVADPSDLKRSREAILAFHKAVCK